MASNQHLMKMLKLSQDEFLSKHLKSKIVEHLLKPLGDGTPGPFKLTDSTTHTVTGQDMSIKKNPGYAKPMPLHAKPVKLFKPLDYVPDELNHFAEGDFTLEGWVNYEIGKLGIDPNYKGTGTIDIEGNEVPPETPINPLTGAPYFTIVKKDWGDGWQKGNKTLVVINKNGDETMEEMPVKEEVKIEKEPEGSYGAYVDKWSMYDPHQAYKVPVWKRLTEFCTKDLPMPEGLVTHPDMWWEHELQVMVHNHFDQSTGDKNPLWVAKCPHCGTRWEVHQSKLQAWCESMLPFTVVEEEHLYLPEKKKVTHHTLKAPAMYEDGMRLFVKLYYQGQGI